MDLFQDDASTSQVVLSLDAKEVQTAASLVDFRHASHSPPVLPCFSREGKLEEELDCAPGSPIMPLWVYPLSPRKS